MIFYNCSDYYNYACEFILFLDSIIIYNKCIDDPKILLDVIQNFMIHVNRICNENIYICALNIKQKLKCWCCWLSFTNLLNNTGSISHKHFNYWGKQICQLCHWIWNLDTKKWHQQIVHIWWAIHVYKMWKVKGIYMIT